MVLAPEGQLQSEATKVGAKKISLASSARSIPSLIPLPLPPCSLPVLPALPFFPPHPMTPHVLPLVSSLGHIQWPEATNIPLTPTTGPTPATAAGAVSHGHNGERPVISLSPELSERKAPFANILYFKWKIYRIREIVS